MNIYQASVIEKIEMFEELIETEIGENNNLIQKYNEQDSQVQVLEYFKERLGKIKNEFETAKKVIKQM